MTYLQLPDKDFVHPVPLLAGPADQQAFPAHLLLQSQVTENLQSRVMDPLFWPNSDPVLCISNKG